MPPTSKQALIADLLTDLFAEIADMQVMVRRLPRAGGLLDRVPSTGVSETQFVEALSAELVSHGMVNDALRVELIARRPNREGDILRAFLTMGSLDGPNPVVVGPDGQEYVVLPFRPIWGRLVVAAGRQLVSNATYLAHMPPPPVCVSFWDAALWARSVNQANPDQGVVSVMPSELWSWCAFDRISERGGLRPEDWLNTARVIHHLARGPAPQDTDGRRRNSLGISDMIGNVWEWTRTEVETPAFITAQASALFSTRVQGGGFLDDLTRVRPVVDERLLPEGVGTRHSDLRFRSVLYLDAQWMPEDKLPPHTAPEYPTKLLDAINAGLRWQKDITRLEEPMTVGSLEEELIMEFEHYESLVDAWDRLQARSSA